MQAIINKEVNKMLEDVVSRSTWSSSPIMMKKKDGSHRFCINFRKVYDDRKRRFHPLSYVIAMLDKLREARYFSILDLKNGYWQISLHVADSRPITAFIGRGLLQFRVMQFGLHSDPAATAGQDPAIRMVGTKRIRVPG